MDTIEVGKAAPKAFKTGQTTVGTTAVKLTGGGRCLYGVLIKVLTSQGPVHVGEDNSVTTGTGLEVTSNESTFIPIDDPSKVWLISATADQTVTWAYF